MFFLEFNLPDPKTIHDSAMTIVGGEFQKYVSAVLGIAGFSIVMRSLLRR